MAGPVEEKPFTSKVSAEAASKSGSAWLLRDSKDGVVATIHADADRVEEIVRLINAGVAPAQPEAKPDHAHPQTVSFRDRFVSTGGLTKREWFAGQAIVGLYQFISALNSGNNIDTANLARIAAETAYLTADAMVSVGTTMSPQTLAQHIAGVIAQERAGFDVDVDASARRS